MYQSGAGGDDVQRQDLSTTESSLFDPLAYCPFSSINYTRYPKGAGKRWHMRLQESDAVYSLPNRLFSSAAVAFSAEESDQVEGVAPPARWRPALEPQRPGEGVSSLSGCSSGVCLQSPSEDLGRGLGGLGWAIQMFEVVHYIVRLGSH